MFEKSVSFSLTRSEKILDKTKKLHFSGCQLNNLRLLPYFQHIYIFKTISNALPFSYIGC